MWKKWRSKFYYEIKHQIPSVDSLIINATHLKLLLLSKQNNLKLLESGTQ